MIALRRKVYAFNQCVSCEEPGPVASWGDEPRCYPCHGLNIVDYDEGTQTVTFAARTCKICKEWKDHDGLCLCNYMPVDGELQQ